MAIFLFTGFLIEKLTALPDWYLFIKLYYSYFFGGYFITIEAYKKIIKGSFDIDFLMIAAAVGAAYIGSWAEGAFFYFFLV